MINILRLDYSKAPPGLDVAGPWPAGLIVAAWKDYKREHDPPGMRVEEVESEVPEEDGWSFSTGNETWSADWDEVEARAAAWAWHDRRHALAIFWPVCLTWTDGQVAEVERWLPNRAAKMPEVLRD